MNNFSINPNFSMGGFEKTIDEYNKNFSNNLNEIDNNFDKVFNSLGQSSQMEPIKAFVGVDAINSQKIELSPTAKMADDIGKGFIDSLNNLNTIERKAEDDIETFASGGDISVHEVMISTQKSNLAMQMAIQLRNQMLNAYNEFKGMSL